MKPTRRQATGLSLCVLMAYAVMAADDRPGWLNVKDHGASGSEFQASAQTTAGSNQIVVKDVGDFKVGQGVMVSKSNIQYTRCMLRTGMYERKPLGDAMEIRGYDGSGGGWVVFVIDIDGADPPTFRWSDDIGRTWKAKKVPITYDWQHLGAGVEICFTKKIQWKPGHVITFDARDQLMTTIEKIEGNTLTLKHPANRTVKNAVVRHEDSAALQAAVKRAIKEKRNVYFPVGHYRLLRGITVHKAEGITLEGASSVHTVLDISEGFGSCIRLSRGTRVTIRNFRMVGSGGMVEGNPRVFRTSGGFSMWRMHMKPCNAVGIRATEHVLIENVHASRMSTECFYCQGPGRKGREEPKEYTKSITYLRCTVTDCGFNAFNNNDMSESTSILYCRVENINNCFWEGPGRFIKIIGNYARNTGVVGVGNMFHRYEHLHDLGIAQTIVANNVFEGTSVNRAGINVRHCANQVVIRNNLFINYGSTAINLDSSDKSDFSEQVNSRDKSSYPPGKVTVTGNIIDLTYHGEKPQTRTGLQVSLSDAIISDNQIYVRGECDPNVHGILIKEPAINVNVHDNLVRNCATGITTARVQASVGRVIDSVSFLRRGRALPLEWRDGHLYRGWTLAWLTGSKPKTLSVIERFDPDTLCFKLTKPREMKAGDRFEVFPPSANWNIHDNTITGCAQPVALDSYGSDTSLFKDNIITRGGAKDVKQAIHVAGRFNLIGNRVSGFDEDGSTALALSPDRAGRDYKNIFRKNVFQNCANVVKEAKEGMWKSAIASGNLFIDCGDAPSQPPDKTVEQDITPVVIQPPRKPVLLAPRLKSPVKVDGDVSEWPWSDKARVAVLERGPAGEPLKSHKGQAIAAHDGKNLYLALRSSLPKGAKIQVVQGFDQGDGVEVSFRNADPKKPTPIFLLWGSAGGAHEGSTAMGASAEQAEALKKATTYAARQTKDGWTCEWRIPFAAMGLKPDDVATLLFNLGVQCAADGQWVAWVPTGGRLCDVDSAGELRREP